MQSDRDPLFKPPRPLPMPSLDCYAVSLDIVQAEQVVVDRKDTIGTSPITFGSASSRPVNAKLTARMKTSGSAQTGAPRRKIPPATAQLNPRRTLRPRLARHIKYRARGSIVNEPSVSGALAMRQAAPTNWRRG